MHPENNISLVIVLSFLKREKPLPRSKFRGDGTGKGYMEVDRPDAQKIIFPQTYMLKHLFLCIPMLINIPAHLYFYSVLF